MLALINYLFLLFALFSNPNPESSNYNVTSIPGNLKENAHAVIRNNETTFTVKSINSASKKVKYAITILDENAAENASIYLPYDKLSKINYLRGSLYDKNGKEVKEFKKSDIVDISMNTIANSGLIDDGRLKIINPAFTQYPYTVEYEYEITFNGLLFYPIWQPQEETNLAVEGATFNIITPKDLKFRFKEVNVPDKAAITTEGNNEVYSWKVNNLEAKEAIPFGPAFTETVPVVYTAPTDFEIEGYKGNMNTWADFGKWINQLNKGKEMLPEPTIAKIKALIADAPDDLTKIQRLYHYLQSNTRYVSIQLGIGGWQPFEASFVDKKGYGDCKALSNYMHAMLKAVGIDSYYTLIKAGRNTSDIRVDFPSNQFNHAVICVPMAKDTVWLECTSQTESWGYSGSFTGNRHALMITPEGGKIVRTPVYQAIDNQQKRAISLQVDLTGNAKAQVVTTYTGLQQDEVSTIALAGVDEQKKWLYNQISIPSFTVNKFEFNQTKGKIPTVTETLQLTINKCATLSGKRLFLTPNLMNQLSGIPPRLDSRASDVVIQQAFYDQDIVQFEIPIEIFQPELLPEPQVIKSRFGEYSASFKMDNNRFVYTRTFRMNKGQFPSTAYPELIDFYKTVNKADKLQAVFATK